MPDLRWLWDDETVWCTAMTSDDKTALWIALILAIVVAIIVVTR
jgi:hypothetical protein